MKLLRVCWRLLLFFVAVSFLFAGLNCQAESMDEQDEGILVVWVFGYTDRTENESIPIEGAQVSVCPFTVEFKDPELSYREREKAEAEFRQLGLTDKNGMVVSNILSSLYYYNTTLYLVRVESMPQYYTSGSLVDITETKEVQIFLKQSSKGGWIGDPVEQTQPLISNPYFMLVLISTVAMGTAILAWSLKQRKAHAHESYKI